MLNNKGEIDPFAAVFMCLLLLGAIVGMFAIYHNLQLDREYIHAGYTKTLLPGRADPIWIKPQEFIKLGQLYPEGK